MHVEPLIAANDLIGDATALQRRLRRDGYLFFRDLLPREEVLDLRRRMLEACAEAGWIQAGTELMDGVTDHAPAWWVGGQAWEPVYEKIQKLEAFHRLKLQPRIREIMEALFEEEVFCIPQTIGRIVFPQNPQGTTQPHQDWLYVQGSTETISGWVPLGDLPAEMGGVMVQAGSHKAGFLFPRLATGPGGNTVDVDPTLPWHVAGYRAGDVLLFHALVVHGARPNLTVDRLRLSLDFRYVGVSHTIMEDWLRPHFHWHDSRFEWENLDAGWTDTSLRRYWERGPKMRTRPHERRLYARE